MRLFESKNPFASYNTLWEDDQTRIEIGNRAQIQVAKDIKRKFPRSRLISMSVRGSKKTDIDVEINPKLEIKIEVKYIKNMVTVYDVLLQRNQQDSFLDWFASRLPFNTLHLSFAALIDKMRKKDKKIGFVGDEGTAQYSGKIPAWWLSSPQVTTKIRDLLIKRYIDRGDNYFAMVGVDGKVSYFHLQGPVVPALGNTPFPHVIRAKTDTYGNAPPGYVRAAIKVQLAV
jgi:hypothetical protein